MIKKKKIGTIKKVSKMQQFNLAVDQSVYLKREQRCGQLVKMDREVEDVVIHRPSLLWHRARVRPCCSVRRGDVAQWLESSRNSNPETLGSIP